MRHFDRYTCQGMQTSENSLNFLLVFKLHSDYQSSAYHGSSTALQPVSSIQCMCNRLNMHRTMMQPHSQHAHRERGDEAATDDGLGTNYADVGVRLVFADTGSPCWQRAERAAKLGAGERVGGDQGAHHRHPS